MTQHAGVALLLARELPPGACREILNRLEAARYKGEAAKVAVISVDTRGVVHVKVSWSKQFSVNA